MLLPLIGPEMYCLDLDNTLWGGIGEDGPAGIASKLPLVVALLNFRSIFCIATAWYNLAVNVRTTLMTLWRS